jgi:hypothetical protein
VPVVAAQAFSREMLTLSFTASLFITVYLALSLAYPKNHLQVPSSYGFKENKVRSLGD